MLFCCNALADECELHCVGSFLVANKIGYCFRILFALHIKLREHCFVFCQRF